MWELGPAEVIAAAALIIAAVSARYAHGAMQAAKDSAQAAKDSAQADTTLARIEEEKRKEELAPIFDLTPERPYPESYRHWEVTVQSLGPQDWDAVTVRMLHDDNGQLPPVLMNGAQVPFHLGSMPRWHKERLSFEIAEHTKWKGAVRLEFRLQRYGEMEPVIIKPSVKLG